MPFVITGGARRLAEENGLDIDTLAHQHGYAFLAVSDVEKLLPQRASNTGHPESAQKRRAAGSGHQCKRRRVSSSSLTAEEVHTCAQVEGLTLVPAPHTNTGFAGVIDCGSEQAVRKKRFRAEGPGISKGAPGAKMKGYHTYLGHHATAAEAALAYARHLGPEASAVAAALAAKLPILTPAMVCSRGEQVVATTKLKQMGACAKARAIAMGPH